MQHLFEDIQGMLAESFFQIAEHFGCMNTLPIL